MSVQGELRLTLTVERTFDLAKLTAHWSEDECADLRIDEPDSDEAGGRYDEAIDALTADAIQYMVNNGNDDVFVDDFKIKIGDGNG